MHRPGQLQWINFYHTVLLSVVFAGLQSEVCNLKLQWGDYLKHCPGRQSYLSSWSTSSSTSTSILVVVHCLRLCIHGLHKYTLWGVKGALVKVFPALTYSALTWRKRNLSRVCDVRDNWLNCYSVTLLVLRDIHGVTLVTLGVTRCYTCTTTHTCLTCLLAPDGPAPPLVKTATCLGIWTSHRYWTSRWHFWL